jgi:predicted MFS family arabinose efflux permease
MPENVQCLRNIDGKPCRMQHGGDRLDHQNDRNRRNDGKDRNHGGHGNQGNQTDGADRTDHGLQRPKPGMALLPATPAAWLMLLALCSTFCLSQAYRTTAAMMASRLQADFSLTAQQLGGFAGAFHFAFGAMQLFMGIGIDLHGVRRTLLVAFPFAVIGSVVSAVSSHYAMVVVGQILIGVGCAPAFLVCTVFIARSYPPQRFAAVSGMVMGVGGLGMLATATPLAWLVQASSWRAGFLALGAGSVLAWLIVFLVVRDPAPAARDDAAAPATPPRESVGAALRSFGGLFTVPHTLGILLLASVTYAAFMTLRGLWLGPLLLERFGFTLVQSGNVALLVSIVSLIGPPLFGRLPAIGARRRGWIIGFTLIYAALFCMLAVFHLAATTIAASVLIGFMSGFIVLQYADVRAAYPAALTGRAMALYTMAMFLGIGVMQWATGAVATLARQQGIDPYTAVLLAISAALLLGAAGFAFLPAPPRQLSMPD